MQSESPVTINSKRLKGNGGSISTTDGEAPPAEDHLPPARIGETDSSGEQLGGVLALRADPKPEENTTKDVAKWEPNLFTANVIFERAWKVFPSDSAEAAKSGIAIVAKKCNNALMTRALEAIKEFIKSACNGEGRWQLPSRAPLEKMLAWVLVDIMGGKLLDSKAAETMGKRLLKRINASAAEVDKIEARARNAIKAATAGVEEVEVYLASVPARVKKEEELKAEREKLYTNFVEAFPPAPAAASEPALVALPEKQPIPPAPAGCMGCRVQKSLIAELREENAILRGKLLDFGMLPTRVLARHRNEWS